jgi:DNA-binding NtrC family response regulator
MRHTVLFVDDEPNVLSALQHTLHKENYDIRTAQSGQEALEIIRNDPIDVIVSDDRMPGMLGSELLATVQQEFPLIVRLLLTGQASVDSAVRAINDGRIYRFLIKPCYEELAISIRQALQQRELMIESNKLLTIAQRQADLLEEYSGEVPDISGFGFPNDQQLDDENAMYDIDDLIDEIGKEVKKTEKNFAVWSTKDQV